MSRRRKFLLAGALVIALLLAGAGALWVLKPWAPRSELVHPGPTGERVSERGLFANYFPVEGGVPGPAVLVLGGSEGGIDSSLKRQAIDLQMEGFSVLTPSYFGAPGQLGNLELVPLETFDRALNWLCSRPEVDPDRVAIMGHSKGAEAALLAATRHPEVRALVASAPSSVVWPGIDWTSFKADPSWTARGKPLSVLPYGPFRFSLLFGDVGSLYEEGLEKQKDHPEAAIEVEKIRAPILLVCGKADSLWPACPMARQLRDRASERGGAPVRVLAYDGAGHRSFGPPVAPDHQSLRRWGGTSEANNAARVDGWPKVIDFLREHLRRSG